MVCPVMMEMYVCVTQYGSHKPLATCGYLALENATCVTETEF